jgi:hypothetical protein
MFNLKKNTTSVIALIVIMVLLTSYNFIGAAWTNPTATPPGNNTDTPLNTSSIAQDKTGNLSVLKMQVLAATPIVEFLDSSTNEKDWRMGVENSGNSFVVRSDRNQSANWDSADGNNQMVLYNGATSSEDYVQFSSKVRATEYCNRNGSKCATIDDLINLLPYSCDVKFSYDIDDGTPVVRNVNLTGSNNSKFAIAIYTKRSDSYPTPSLITDELGRNCFDSGTYDWDNTCHRSIQGYADPLNVDENPTAYDDSGTDNHGSGSSGFIVATVPLKAGSIKTITNLGHDGFGGGRVDVTAEVLNCQQ